MSRLVRGCFAALCMAAAACLGATDTPQRVREFRVAHERALLNEFIELLKIPNVASDSANIARNADAVAAMLQRRGLAPRLLRSIQAPNAPPVVYAEWTVPNAKRTVVLYAHYDGQPVNESEWVTGPWTPTLRTGPLNSAGSVISATAPGATDPEVRLYARGAGDDKVGVMVIISAIEALKAIGRRPTDTIKLVFEGEEEAGSPHLHEILEENRALLSAQLWVVCDGPLHPSGRRQVIYGVRGDMNVDLTVYGPNRPLHSGHYGNWAPNPALRLARLLASMKDANDRVAVKGWYDDVQPLGATEQRAIAESSGYDETLRRELGLAATDTRAPLAAAITEPSLNINGMRSANVGAQSTNIIPETASAVLDIRLVQGNEPQRQYERLLEHVRANGYYVIDREPTAAERLLHPLIATMRLRPGAYAAQRTSMDEPLARSIANAIRMASDQPILELPTLGGSLPLSIMVSVLGSPAIVVPTANFDDNQHAANENLRLGNLWDGIELYAALLTHPPTP